MFDFDVSKSTLKLPVLSFMTTLHQTSESQKHATTLVWFFPIPFSLWKTVYNFTIHEKQCSVWLAWDESYISILVQRKTVNSCSNLIGSECRGLRSEVFSCIDEVAPPAASDCCYLLLWHVVHKIRAIFPFCSCSQHWQQNQAFFSPIQCRDF